MGTKSNTIHAGIYEAYAPTAHHRDDLLDAFDEVLAVTLALKSEKARIEEELAKVKEELSQLTIERTALNHAAMHAEAEHLSSIMVNLYVAIERIHGSLERDRVIAAIEEVIVNQVGSEDFAIFERAEGGASLSLVSSIGVGAGRLPDAQVLMDVLSSGAIYVRNEEFDPPGAPAACIPLKVGDRVTGVIAIHSLLCHKERFEPLDHELCNVLAVHAGVALYTSALHARASANGAKR